MSASEKKASRIGDIIPEAFEEMGLSGRLREAELVREWSSIAGEVLAERSRVDDLRDGILHVVAENNLWMQEISFMQNRIIENIRNRFPGLEINGLRTFIEKEKGEE